MGPDRDTTAVVTDFYCEHAASKSRVFALVRVAGRAPALRAVFSCTERVVSQLAAEVLSSVAVHGLGPNVTAVAQYVKSVLPAAPAASFQSALESAVVGVWVVPEDVTVLHDDVEALYGYEQSDEEPVTPALRDSVLRASSQSRLRDYPGVVIRHIQLAELHVHDAGRLVAAATATGWEQHEEPGFTPTETDKVIDAALWFFDQAQDVPGTDIITQASEAKILRPELGDEVHDWSPESVVANFGTGWMLGRDLDDETTGELEPDKASESKSGPDFAALFPIDRTQPEEDEEGGWRLTPRTADALYTALCVLSDEAYDDANQHRDTAVDPRGQSWMVFDRLPRPTWKMDSAWRRKFARAADDLRFDLKRGQWPIPTCSAEEMCLHLAIEDAQAFTQAEQHRLLPAHEDDYTWDACSELFFEDHDILIFDDPALDGFEDPEGGINRQLGVGDLRPTNWFQQFNNAKARDPNRGYRR